MKKRILTMFLAIAIMFTISGCGDQSSSSSFGFTDYKELIKKFYSSISTPSPASLFKCLDKESRVQISDKNDMDVLKRDLSYLDESYSDQYGDDWNKTYKIRTKEKTRVEDGVTYYDVPVAMGDDAEDITVKIVKIKDKYYIQYNYLIELLGV